MHAVLDFVSGPLHRELVFYQMAHRCDRHVSTRLRSSNNGYDHIVGNLMHIPVVDIRLKHEVTEARRLLIFVILQIKFLLSLGDDFIDHRAEFVPITV